jgi:hypothetical protein
MQRKLVCGILLAAVAFVSLVAAALLVDYYAHIRGPAAWSEWVNEITVASQPGSDEQSVRLLLGEPDEVRSPARPLLGLTPPAPDVPGAQRVLIYTTACFQRGWWVAHIYVDKDGRVLAYHIGTS